MTNEANGSPSPFKRLCQTSHAPDYVGLVILLTAWVMIDMFVTPFHRMFSTQDLRLSFPFAEHERVSVSWNFVYALFVPLGCLVTFNILARASVRKHEATYLCFLVAITLTQVLVDVVKNAVGRPRPDLLARCRPSPNAADPRALVTIAACTAPRDRVLEDGWRSFPSGHSSFSFAGLGFLSLFLAGQLHVFNHATARRDLGRDLVCLAPLLGALLIAISRCQDYRHDVYDVTVGCAIGMAVAYWSYRRHWPPLSSPVCDEPRGPPPGLDAAPGWQRVRDEEEAGIEAGVGAAGNGYPLNARLG
ncbi:putative diacylglycerol pyrophosphate phosphatase 1 [Escovopsis weberi]|uniref:Putative diacylglycerol pyrophosphate phosphatase 1 n=1 Tax=Escovopsis weberi TaxID=150374 RepID=A0A0M8MZ52_ESCWE|nr:putative diacylglycerol pyrophosphate phosphatase 1 [Escovopsis weberi]